MQEYQRVFSYLDAREIEGYQRLQLTIQTEAKEEQAYVYVATVDNPHFLQGWSLEATAHRISIASGPSGSNLEYFRRLRLVLQEFAPPDQHIEELALFLSDSKMG